MDSVFQSGQVYHPRFALRRTSQMLLGLRETHASGYVHRDVKPDNFLIYSDGTIRLSDFGCGRTIDQGGLRLSTTCVGTPQYAAPEQLAGLGVDQRSDLYAVGVVLYEMLMGHRPGRGIRYLRPSARYGNILPGVDMLCSSLLSPARSHRPRSVIDVLARVESLLTTYRFLRQKFEVYGQPSPY